MQKIPCVEEAHNVSIQCMTQANSKSTDRYLTQMQGEGFFP
jgi:hypothetical protein